MQSKEAKAGILEFFYEHVEDNDWLEGVDLYQAGKVGGVQDYQGLIIGEVEATFRRNTEVRLKIHPSGKTIQWIECSCAKNRAQNRYCEHMAAFMIHLDRERPQIFGNLDAKMPLKPPAPTRRVAKQNTVVPTQTPTTPIDRQAGAAQTILKHLEGSIHSISLLSHGPNIRVRIEIKAGSLTHYDLNLDASAKFLATHPNNRAASPEVRALEVSKHSVQVGTRIYQEEDEKIVAERVIVIKHTEKSAAKRRDEPTKNSEVAKHKLFSQTETKGKEGWFEFFPIKGVSKYVGTEYFFLPERGYWPIERELVTSAWHELPLKKVFKDDEAAKLVRNHFAEYLSAGPVWLSDELQDPIIVDAPKLAAVHIHEERDGWFFLDPQYGTGKSSVSMARLMEQFSKKKRDYIKSGSTWLKIPELVTEHQWELDESGQYIKVDALGLMRLRAAVGDFDQFVGSKKILNELRNRLEFNDAIDLPSLSQTKLNLREYQETGVKWMWWLYHNRLHGLLADEMGLGKTHQAMALLSTIQTTVEKPRFLIIAPTTVLDHWEDKVNDFCPNLKPIKHHGPKRSQNLDTRRDDQITVITSYGVLLRDIRQMSQIKWDAVILDEAHFVKNNDTATYQSVCRLNARIRICLTGTPMENNLGELKSIFDFLVPGYLGSDEYFNKQFISPIVGGVEPEVELALQKLIHPFKMRRTKDQVLKDLPAKVEDLRHCALSDEQVQMYRDVVAMKAAPLVQQLKDENASVPYLHVFATLTMLKQICDHPALIAKDGNITKHESGKFELLKELLDEALGSGHKIVIYSQYVGMIALIETYLKSKNIGHCVLTGQTRNRGQVIDDFQTNPEKKVFLGSLLAGGIGIDLTAASVVIHYDRWWNASKENQATDRVHRIGQNKNVQVLKLVTRGTLEEKIDALIKSKQALFEKFLDKDEEVFKNLSRQELIELLQ